VWQHVLWVGGLMAAVCLLVQAWALHTDGSAARAQTMVFTVLTLAQMGHVMAIRAERASLASIGYTSNVPLLGAVLLTFVLQLLLVYLPSLNAVFGTVPLTAGELGLCLAASAIPLVAVELEKRWFGRW
jgi:P-type Ca2+ transporter type 2C